MKRLNIETITGEKYEINKIDLEISSGYIKFIHEEEGKKYLKIIPLYQVKSVTEFIA